MWGRQSTHRARVDPKASQPAADSVSFAPCRAPKLPTGHPHAPPCAPAPDKCPQTRGRRCGAEPPRPTCVHALPEAGEPVAEEGAPRPCPGSLRTGCGRWSSAEGRQPGGSHSDARWARQPGTHASPPSSTWWAGTRAELRPGHHPPPTGRAQEDGGVTERPGFSSEEQNRPDL